MQHEIFDNELSAFVWERKYRYCDSGSGVPESSLRASWQRVAAAVASVEPVQRSLWHSRFLAMLDRFRFLPAGRILASAGTAHDATLFNCFVIGAIEDSIDGIFARLRESAVTLRSGGGIGCDFSTLRPAGAAARTSGRSASGPVSFMHLWNTMCATLLASGNRRGAMMGVLRCDHPDIGEFADAKRRADALTNFNLSVQVTDEFMQAVARDREWALVFPNGGDADEGPAKLLRWSGNGDPVPCGAVSRVSAGRLWRRIVDAAYDTAEPGVLFIDRINRLNNLHYREHITATNPCGEVPLPPNGACNLGSINLAALVSSPYTDRAALDIEAIGALARDATRFLDNVIDLSRFPLPAQKDEARTTRRIGLGVTGLADALIMLGLHYGSDAARETARTVLTRIRDAAYEASVDLAREKGSFPALIRDDFLDGAYAATLPARIRDRIARHGLRNSHLLAIAPAGSISVLANHVSSGIEPVFAPRMQRIVSDGNGQATRHEITDYAYSVWLSHQTRKTGLPPEFVTAEALTPEDHLLMAAVLQPIVDNSISKTVNVAESVTRDQFSAIYTRAHELGLKGCTAFRATKMRGSVLSALAGDDAVHCRGADREGDC